jgi:hypothetical protein
MIFNSEDNLFLPKMWFISDPESHIMSKAAKPGLSSISAYALAFSHLCGIPLLFYISHPILRVVHNEFVGILIAQLKGQSIFQEFQGLCLPQRFYPGQVKNLFMTLTISDNSLPGGY